MKNQGLFLILPALLAASLAQAQYNPDKVNKKAAQLYSKALEQAQGYDFKQGIQTLQEAGPVEKSFEYA